MTLALLALLSSPAGADEIVYGDELAEGWYSWSWTGNFNFNATEQVRTGKFSIFAGVNEYGALSLFREGGFHHASALSFWIEGDAPPVALVLEAVGFQVNTDGIPVTDMVEVHPGQWSNIVVSLDALAPLPWSRFDLVDYSGVGAAFHVDDVYLLELDPLATAFTSAEPLGNDRIVLLGGGDPAAIAVSLDDQPVEILDVEISGAPTRATLTLAAPIGPGALVITTADDTHRRRVEEVAITIGDTPTHEISPDIYGASFPEGFPGQEVLDWLGVTAARWGGNATAMYNPDRRATSLGADWYFMNEGLASSPGEWLTGMAPHVGATLLTVPSLDWVAADGASWAYSVEKYGEQQEVAPGTDDAGNGVLLSGAPITWNDPADAATPWDTEQARRWLEGLETPPTVAAIGNETDIADLTHRATHPEPATFAEQRDRFLDYAAVVKDALPGTAVAGPVSCCWTTYWRSADPDDPDAADADFLPWFLDEVAAADAESGRRTLDYLDIHYYPEGAFDEEVTPAAAAHRLRATRSLWDPEYVDESWIGLGDPVTLDQPAPDRVKLIPRMKALIDEHYPDTKLAITEWSFGAPGHLSGGLAAADALGIFGRQGVDMAMIWPAPEPGDPAASAFRLFLDPAHPFGDQSLPVTGFDPDRLGVYAAMDGGLVTLVAVNKDPQVDFLLTGLPSGLATVRHFGGAAGARVVQDGELELQGSLAVPAYSAVALTVAPLDTDDEPPVVDSGEDTGVDRELHDPVAGSGQRCACSGLPGGGWWLLGLLAVARRRR